MSFGESVFSRDLFRKQVKWTYLSEQITTIHNKTDLEDL
jgi:hypothetical protein